MMFDRHKLLQTFNRYIPWIAVCIIIISAILIRIPLLETPLERDEGEYAYAGQLLLQGIPPYSQAYNMKMPGIYAAYAFIMAMLGQTHGAIHLGLLIINAVTTFHLFLIGKKIFGEFAGVTAAAAFSLLSLGKQVQGIFANAEHFVIFFAVAGLLLLVSYVDSRKWKVLLSGAILLGIGFTIKQHGAAFIVFGGVYILINELSRKPLKWRKLSRNCAIFSGGAILPFAITCLFLWWAGVFDTFWFWTFDYAREYVSSIPLSTGVNILKSQITNIISSTVLIWILAGVGLTSLFWNKKNHRTALFSAGFLLFSFLAICPGFYFRPHYFILFLPAVALLAGAGIHSIYDVLTQSKYIFSIRVILVLLMSVVLLHGYWQQRNYLFNLSPAMVSRMTYGLNPFPESLEIARFIRENSAENDRIAVIGSEPQIYFYSKRLSATGYIYTYGLMEDQPYSLTMQKEMIAEIEKTKPEYMIFVNVSTSWLVRSKSNKLIFNWFNNYSSKYYDLVGIIEIVGKNKSTYRWHQEAIGYSPRSPFWLSVFREKIT
jgi:hypothetical protein